MIQTPSSPSALCIGSVLWDIIGRTSRQMSMGHDVPGRITRLPGGVALNIAMTLANMGHRPALLSAVGMDADGDALVAACQQMQLDCRFLTRTNAPTDQYMAIEGANGLVAAIADAHSLEDAGALILTPLQDGTLGDADTPYCGLIALDGNLTETLLNEIAKDEIFRAADLRLAPASPGKAERLSPFVQTGRGTFYVNLAEAQCILNQQFNDAPEAARAMVAAGAERALVTNGAQIAADATPQVCLTRSPPIVRVHRITGAGDSFMAGHMDAELAGANRADALKKALQIAARYVSMEGTQ
ncbi:MAG: PfkB family carbohydrate kinase [Pseudoprimorskyibacter sp.]|nr:PfkB family carbohydrate kinase [Pseudoprimorskyibacter sp.]